MQTTEILDSNFCDGYKASRMFLLLEILIKSVLTRFYSEFTSEELWDPNNLVVKQKLVELSKVLRLWKEKLMEIQALWRDSKENIWKNDVDLANFNNFLNRLNEILEIRNQFDELARLFRNNLNSRLNVADLFADFRGRKKIYFLF